MLACRVPCARPPMQLRRFSPRHEPLPVERKGIEHLFRPLQSVLSPSTLVSVSGRMRSRGELCHGDRAHGQLDRQLTGIELFEIHDH